MQWNPSPEASVVSYNVYVGTDPTFIPSPLNLLASGISENGYSDYFESDPSITWYYKITSVTGTGQQSLPSLSAGAAMPASTPDNYTDSPPLYTLDSANAFAVAAPPQAKPLVAPLPPPTNLFAFYGAGPDSTEGNIDFGNSPYDTVGGSDAQSIVKVLGGTQKSDQLPYTDWGLDKALHDFCTEMDANGDHIISAGEIAAQTIKVLGYSWGAVEATNFTRMLGVANPHLLGSRTNAGTPKNPQTMVTGGYNLTAAVPIGILVTIDPVLHAAAGFSAAIKTTDGPLANVAKFRNYFETRGGYTQVEIYSMVGGMYQDQGKSKLIGNGFSVGFTGVSLKSASPDTVQIDITTDPAWINKSIRRYFGQFDFDHSEAYGKAKGSDIQHDIIPFYMHDQVVSDIQNG